MVLCLPMRIRAAWLASFPRTTSLASIMCQFLSIPGLDGNTVLMNTRLRLCMRLYLYRLTNAGDQCQTDETERCANARGQRGVETLTGCPSSAQKAGQPTSVI